MSGESISEYMGFPIEVVQECMKSAPYESCADCESNEIECLKRLREHIEKTEIPEECQQCKDGHCDLFDCGDYADFGK